MHEWPCIHIWKTYQPETNKIGSHYIGAIFESQNGLFFTFRPFDPPPVLLNSYWQEHFWYHLFADLRDPLWGLSWAKLATGAANKPNPTTSLFDNINKDITYFVNCALVSGNVVPERVFDIKNQTCKSHEPLSGTLSCGVSFIRKFFKGFKNEAQKFALGVS